MTSPRLSSWALGFLLIVAAVATVVLIGGWLFHVEALRRPLPGFGAMVPTTATSFLVSSIALATIQHPALRVHAHRLAAMTTALLLAVVAGADLMIIGSHAASGIDAVLFPASPEFLTSRMAQGTAFCFLLAAASLATASHTKRRWPGIAYVSASTLGLLISLVVLVAYAFDSAAIYALSVFADMAPHTAIGFAAFFAALLLLRSDIGWVAILAGPDAGSVAARQLFPIVVIGPLILCRLALSSEEIGRASANFRLSVVAIGVVGILAAATLRNAVVQNRVSSKLSEAMMALQKSVADRDLLLREVNHRVRNNLQQIWALLDSASRKTRGSDASTSFKDMTGRVMTMSRVHGCLTANLDDPPLTMQTFITTIADGPAQRFEADRRKIVIQVSADPVDVHAETAVAFGLVVNELLATALHHQFRESGGAVHIECKELQTGSWSLSVVDDGAAGGTAPLAEMSAYVVRALAIQLDKAVTFESAGGRNRVLLMPARLRGEA